MIGVNETNCPNCGGGLKYYDSVPRIVRTKGRVTSQTTIDIRVCILIFYTNSRIFRSPAVFFYTEKELRTNCFVRQPLCSNNHYL